MSNLARILISFCKILLYSYVEKSQYSNTITKKLSHNFHLPEICNGNAIASMFSKGDGKFPSTWKGGA